MTPQCESSYTQYLRRKVEIARISMRANSGRPNDDVKAEFLLRRSAVMQALSQVALTERAPSMPMPNPPHPGEMLESKAPELNVKEPLVPNTITIEAMKQARAGGLKSFTTIEDLMTDLNADD